MLVRPLGAALLASLASLSPALAVGTPVQGGVGIGRFVGPGQILNSGSAGRIDLQVDLSMLPTPTGPVAALPGDDWYFTAWYRDVENGVVTSNFTDGLEVVFQ